MKIDLNCDLGESYGRYQLGSDEAILPYISSANIACGYHAGDPMVMAATVRLACKHRVALGAHPGYPDLQGFGRRDMSLTPAEIEAFVLYQVAALAGFARAAGAELTHVKPHGQLYNHAAKDPASARAIAQAIASFSKSLILVGLAGSQLIRMGEEAGLQVAGEGFADRAYNPDGTLRPRNQPGAVFKTPEEALAQALRLVREGIQVTTGSQTTTIPVDTICLHGDTPGADQNARLIHTGLSEAGVFIGPLRSR